jgi:hypothetical protein
MEGMFSKLPMLAISRGVRKPRPGQICFRLFEGRLALSSGIWSTCSSTPTHSLPTMPQSVRKPIARRVLMSRISQRSS